MKNSYLKKMLSLLLLSGVFLSFGCSIRDYSDNQVLNDHYQGPLIEIISPTPNQNVLGQVTLSAKATDSSGVKSAEIKYNGQVINFTSSSSNTTFNLYTNIMFYIGGNQEISITAYDILGVATTTNVWVYVERVAPYIQITSPWEDTLFTNISSITLEGNVTISTGYVASIASIFNNTTNALAITAGSNWQTTVSLVANSTNDITIRATSDMGVEGYQNKTIIQDSIAPTIVAEYPTNGQSVPKSFRGRAQSFDNVSGVRRVIYQFHTNDVRINDWSGIDEGVTLLDSGDYSVWIVAEDNAGNISSTQTIVFTVDGSIPSIQMNNPWQTNAASFDLTGRAYVEGTTIASLEISINGGAYQAISAFQNIADTLWTNIGTTGFTPNSNNTISIRAISAADKTNEIQQNLMYDTNPPQFKALSPANNTTVLNRASFNYYMELHDNESSIARLLIHQSGIGITNATNDSIYNDWNPDVTINETSANYNGGGLITNILLLFDSAGNTNVRTTVITIYPYLFLDSNGNDANYGFAFNAFRSIQKGVNKAVQLGVNNVLVGMGSYSPGNGLNSSGSGVIITNNDITIYGGWDFIAQTNTNVSILNGMNSLNHILFISGCTNVNVQKFIITAGKANIVSDPMGGGILLNNVNYSHFDNIQLNNNSAITVGSAGGAIAMLDSYNNTFTLLAYSNTSDFGGAIFISNSSYNTFSGNILGNTANDSGGGLYAIESHNNQIDVQAQSNIAGNAGGAIYFASSDNNQIAGDIYENISSNVGGGIYLGYSDNNTINALVVNNNAINNGGGIYLEGSKYNYFQNQINLNTSLYGGGMYFNNSMNNSIQQSLSQNTATQAGGAIYFNNSGENNVFGVISNNTSTMNGGGIYFNNSSQNKLSGEISGNTAVNGGGVYLETSEGNIRDYAGFTPANGFWDGSLPADNNTIDYFPVTYIWSTP